MITLYLKSIDKQQQLRFFTCQLNQLETVLETLSLIAAAGNVLLEIAVTEDGKRMSLPPQAFDGQDLVKPISTLQKQWEILLTEDIETSSGFETDLTLISLVIQYIDQFETRMADCNDTIIRLENLIRTTQNRLREGVHKNRLISHYQSGISRQRGWIEQAEKKRDEYLRRLSQLKKTQQEL